MKKFKVQSIDVKQMSNIRGGIEVSLDNLKINVTKLKKEVAMSQDTKVEVSGTLTIEQ